VLIGGSNIKEIYYKSLNLKPATLADLYFFPRVLADRNFNIKLFCPIIHIKIVVLSFSLCIYIFDQWWFQCGRGDQGERQTLNLVLTEERTEVSNPSFISAGYR